MGLNWGPRTGHYSTTATTRLALRMRIAGLESNQLTARLIHVMQGQALAPAQKTFTADEAGELAGLIGRAARRMWWAPGWRMVAYLIASDAHLAWCEERDWVVD
ncbi:hypothetical protein ABZW10_36495 [Kitasatospora sp. NPDC004723]|uniref:DUF7739 domain-containing protein n=1 Tax=Kitasatospora sp. NPDC004723 TaxID=3154288 RepID=UPI0033B8E1FE